MSILEIIKKEHREASAMLEKAQDMDPDNAELSELVRSIEQALTTHVAIEERLFYSKLRDLAKSDEQKVDVFEGFTEHAVASHLIAMLKSRRKRDERFKAEIQVLGESIKHHVQEEESTIFGIARKLLSADELEDLGAKWTKAREKTPAAGPPKKAPAPRKKLAA